MNRRITRGTLSRIERTLAAVGGEHTERSFVRTYQDGIANALIGRGYAPSIAEKEAIAVSRRAYQLGAESAILDEKSARPMARTMGVSTLASGILLGLGWELGFVAGCTLTSVVCVAQQMQRSRDPEILENDLKIIKGQKDPSSLGYRSFEKHGAEILRNSGYLSPKQPLRQRLACRLTHRPAAD